MIDILPALNELVSAAISHGGDQDCNGEELWDAAQTLASLIGVRVISVDYKGNEVELELMNDLEEVRFVR